VQEAFDLTTSDLAALAKASFAASWLEPAEKATKIEEVQLYLQRLDKARAAPT
jgi:adenosine deaminase